MVHSIVIAQAHFISGFETGSKELIVKRLVVILSVLSAIVFCFTSQTLAEDWLRFLGEDGRATVSGAKAPLEWNEKTNIKWKTALPGPGSSSPIVVGNRVFLTCYTGYGVKPVTNIKEADKTAGDIKKLTRHLICFDRTQGDILWQKSIGNQAVKNEDPFKGYITYHGYATNTPITDGKYVYAFLGKAGLIAFDLDGNEKWRRRFEGEPNKMRWGSAASPIFFGNQLIVNAIDECGKILSIDKSDGKIRWEFDAATRMAYSTPSLIVAGGKTELIVAAPNRVYGVDPETGKQNWFAKTTLDNEVNASIIVEGDIAYIYGGYQGVGSLAVRAGGQGDVTKSHVLWTSKDTSYVSTPVLKDGYIYWIKENGIAFCVDAKSGEQKYRQRVPGFSTARGVKMFASMLVVDDQIIGVSRKNGTTIWKANSEKFELVRQNVIKDDESSFNGTPAIAGDQLFLRSNTYLYCISN